jgi:hypothetical protein
VSLDFVGKLTTTDAPNIAIAGELAAAAVGRPPIKVRRFRTGSHHHVFEVAFEDRAPVVVRIAAEHSRAAMAGRSGARVYCGRRVFRYRR